MSRNIIIILEDDPFQCESIQKDLSASFPDYEILTCPTELTFRKLVSELADRIACVILDAMIPWEFPNENMQIPPSEVQSEGMFKAGRRCLDYLRSRPGGSSIPACMHTILDREDAGIDESRWTRFLSKQPRNSELVKTIAELLAPTNGK